MPLVGFSFASQVVGDGLWKQPLAVGTLNFISLAGKELELVQEVERCWLDTVGLASTHSLGSRVQLFDLHLSCIASSDRQWAGKDLLINQPSSIQHW